MMIYASKAGGRAGPPLRLITDCHSLQEQAQNKQRIERPDFDGTRGRGPQKETHEPLKFCAPETLCK